MTIKKLDQLLKVNYDRKMKLAVVAFHDGELLKAHCGGK